MPDPGLLPTLAAVALQAGWVGVTVALSLAVIALCFIAIAVAAVLAGREAAQAMDKVSGELSQLRAELEPTLRSLRSMGEEGRSLAGKLQGEVVEVIRLSQRLRGDVNRGMRRAKRRLADIDALAEVVTEEVEDTALDVASRLRSLRDGTRVITRLKRLLLRSRR